MRGTSILRGTGILPVTDLVGQAGCPPHLFILIQRFSNAGFFTDSRLPIPDSRFPIPDSRLPTTLEFLLFNNYRIQPV
ncbi:MULTISPECIES: hypothetical protein [Moorena]|uniref:hypothetical protein n=1 Tax=Moorena TaxID=1155738 RepID=UPI001056D81A|nr:MULTISPECIES: hypothetical protein [Moorena]NEP32822.1 hypothetical protein [Moorena sp. SIO3B2]NEQ11582.1 hypothetical protein [Moorena sp. SIO4E2]NER87102.1 hypothetical protein [Moorena sp. SIO3A2]NES46143.1 hypothetical protein [Moorena sp. SIO2C4]